MSAQRKFGAIDGVFTPSILTILGVIMYLRMGWVVGNAGLWGTIIIVVIAHVISFSTGLSISSISTDKKVGAGGVYYVLSRSLGLPIGGAIGLTLFVGTALSIALYLVGFAESFNSYLGLSPDINGLRSTGSLFLLVLTIIAFISTSVAIKTQFFILAAIIISLVSIFVGNGSAAEVSDVVPSFGGAASAPMETVFAIFFPAVTGFTAGIAMSGDLGDPKKDIPFGTIAAISVGFVVYIALAFFLSANVDQELLRSDYNILTKIAYFGPAVVAGIWGATLSSAIGGILGGPRILQAMSLDRITPRLFARGVGAGNEPRNALILTVLIAEAGILIGELDLIARIVSMFYLAAYGFINISFFLERWASSDFKPSFKVSRWVGMVGFIATFAVMFKLDMLAMVAALIIIGGVFLWLQRKQISLGTGDVWQSVWSTVVKSGLKRMEVAEDHKRNWKPNIMLFSGNSEARPHLIEFGKALAGQVGMVTNFDLVENREAKVLFPKHKQNISDELLQKYGVFGRRIEVNNVYKGIETIATTFGFSGLDPNTVLMGWAKNTNDPIWFAQMTEKLIALDYNVLYLDYDKRWGFRKREQIDLWWRGISNNAELMLHLARFITAAPGWRNARIRVLLVNDFNVDRRIIENRIQLLLDEFRVQAEIKVINNAVDRKPFYELMKTISAEADLVFIGIPHIKPGKEASFVSRTNELVGIIGTTLLVKASSTFETTQLGLKNLEQKQEYEPERSTAVAPLEVPEDDALANIVQQLDEHIGQAVGEFGRETLSVLQQHYLQWLSDTEERMLTVLAKAEEQAELPFATLYSSLADLVQLSEQFTEEELSALQRVLESGVERFRKKQEEVIKSLPASVRVAHAGQSGKTVKLKLHRSLNILQSIEAEPQLKEALNALGLANANLVLRTAKRVREGYDRLSKMLTKGELETAAFAHEEEVLQAVFQRLREQAHLMVEGPLSELQNAGRRVCNRLAEEAGQPGFYKKLRKERRQLKRKTLRGIMAYSQNYSRYWARNQELLHRNYDASLQLTQVSLQLNERKTWALREVREGYMDRIVQEIRSLQELVQQARQSLETGDKEAWDKLPLHLEENDFDNTEAVLWRFTEAMKQISAPLPSEITLLDQASRDHFRLEQGSGINTLSLALDDIASYLVDVQFVSPFQQQLTTLRQQLGRVSGSVYNRASLLSYGLDSSAEDKPEEGLQELLDKAAEELRLMYEAVGTIYSTFTAEVQEKYEATEAALRIASIVTHADELSQYVRKISRRRGLSAWRTWLETQLVQVQRDWSAFIARKREDAAAVAFERKQAQLRGDRDRLRAFAETVGADRDALAALPFYYRQLFSGKHLNLGRKAVSRQAELAEVKKALAYQADGLRGGVMITGDPLSGKSYFMEYAARQLTKGDILRVVPPPGGASVPRALQKAFEQASGKRGAINSILEELPEGSAILLEDVELWWLRQEEGRRAIGLLIETIQAYSLRHRFFMTANLDALKQLREQTSLERALLSTLVLSPFSPMQLRQELWARHKTGGVQLLFQGGAEGVLSDKAWDHLFDRLYRQSEGNVGLGLHHWLAQIRSGESSRLNWRDDWSVVEFPELEDPSWYFVLLQLYLHKALSHRRFRRLFESEGEDWVEDHISELHKAQVLVPHSREVLELRPAIRYYLGRRLKEKDLI
jgi:amino acid transporter